MFSSKKEIKKQQQEKHQDTSLFGRGSTFTGCIEATNDLRIDGKVIGKIIAKSKMVSGPASVIEGPIEGIQVEIMGQVKGDIHVSGTLTLKSTAVIEGNIFTANLAMENGAIMNGKCQVGVKSSKQVKMTNDNDAEADKMDNSPLSVAG